MNLIWVAFGGAIGASARYGINVVFARLLGGGFPFATIVVNVIGCLAMGIVAGLLQTRLQMGEGLRLFLTTGILGGFTTFSAFALDVVKLGAERGQTAAVVYVLLSVLLSIAAVYTGLALARVLA
jgi:fluoride exporter